MTGEELLGPWLEARLLTVDDELATRIRSAIPAADLNAPVVQGSEALGIAASTALRALLAGDCETRASALDLLLVDALVTYACEAATEGEGDVAARADFVLHQVASVSQDRSATA
ncbi:MAG: hypothetical protein ACR2MQ_00590 [Gemmatimonadaceae bacterium]